MRRSTKNTSPKLLLSCESVTIYSKPHWKKSQRSLNCCFCKAVGKTKGAGPAKASSRRKNILNRHLKSRNSMLFPEKMIDFVRTTGPLLICCESLASGKYLDKMAKKKKKKKKNTIKIKFKLQAFNLHQVIQRELMIEFFL